MKVYHIGVDLHKTFSQITVLDDGGTVLDRSKVYSNREEIKEYFSGFEKGTPVAFEATGSWYWFKDLLDEMSLDGKMAHPKKVRLIAESVIKTDAIDSEVLAHLERLNYLPQAYMPSKEIRQVRELLRYRMSLVRLRTEVKNKVHAALGKLCIKHEFSDLFGKQGLEF